MKFAPRFKMPAGSALLYATSSIHRVEPVTAGERLVAITWIESRIADPFTRQINADILQVLNLLSQDGACAPEIKRSEEHTSELQSLMRISYAVFCLKKKKTTQVMCLIHIKIIE